MNSLVIFESKTFIINACYIIFLYPIKKIFTIKTTKKTILASRWQIPIGKVMGWEIPSYITIKNHCIPCNM
jgi:hypothetical protein